MYAITVVKLGNRLVKIERLLDIKIKNDSSIIEIKQAIPYNDSNI